MATAMKLYELSDKYNELLELLEIADDKELFLETLASISDSFEVKVESIIKLWRQKCAERDFVKQERVRLEAIEKRKDKEAQWLHDYVESQMKRTGIKEVKSPLFKIMLQNNPKAVDVIDETAIPEQYWKPQDPVIDKKAIKEAIEAGETVPGAALKQDQSLRIR